MKGLARDANVPDEQRARDVAKSEFANKHYVRYHAGREELALDPTDAEAIRDMLIDTCEYAAIQVETTLDSYLD